MTWVASVWPVLAGHKVLQTWRISSKYPPPDVSAEPVVTFPLGIWRSFGDVIVTVSVILCGSCVMSEPSCAVTLL